MGKRLRTNAIKDMSNDFANEVIALLERVSRKVALVFSLVRSKHLA